METIYLSGTCAPLKVDTHGDELSPEMSEHIADMLAGHHFDRDESGRRVARGRIVGEIDGVVYSCDGAALAALLDAIDRQDRGAVVSHPQPPTLLAVVAERILARHSPTTAFARAGLRDGVLWTASTLATEARCSENAARGVLSALEAVGEAQTTLVVNSTGSEFQRCWLLRRPNG